MKNQPFRRMDFSFAPGLKTSEDLPGLELRNPSRWHYLVGFMLWKGGSHPKYLNIIWTYLMQTKTRNLLEKLPKVLIVVIVILFLSPTILSSVADFFCSKTSTGSRSWETWYLERLFCFFSVQYLYCILYIYMTYISYISYIYRYTTIICKHIYIYINNCISTNFFFSPGFWNVVFAVPSTAFSTEAPSLVEFWGQRVAEFARRQSDSLLIAVQVEMPKNRPWIFFWQVGEWWRRFLDFCCVLFFVFFGGVCLVCLHQT